MSNIISDIKAATGDILTSVRDALSFIGPTRNFNDYNKKAKDSELALYALVSSNLSPDYYTRISAGIEASVVNSIRMIVSTAIETDPVKAIEFVRNNFTNGKDLADQIQNGIHNIRDALSESGVDVEAAVMIEGVDFGSSLNEKSFNLMNSSSKALKKEPLVAQSKVAGKVAKQHTGLDTGVYTSFSDGDKAAANALKANATQHNFVITIAVPGQAPAQIGVAIFTKVKMMPVDAAVLLDALASVKSRDMLSNYISMRAGATSFFRDFVLNMKEIQKQVKRNTSDNVTERVLASLLSKSGFTRPKMISEVTELKNFTIAITAEDADRLTRDFNINLNKAADLAKVFAGMNILSLIILDEARGRAVFYQSDSPTEMTVVSIRDLADAQRLGAIFSSLNISR